MAMNFPDSPTVGQTFSVTGGPTYSWNGTSWRVLTPGSQFNRTTFTATAGQTVFSVTYTVGAVDVFRNGVKLVDTADFTATNGTSITLANAATVGDTIEVIAYSQVVYSTAAKAEDVYSVVRGMKNRIINGDMRINQRSFSATPANFDYLADRWQFRATQASKFTSSQSTTAPASFVNSLLFTSSAATTPGSTDQFGIRQFIEGLNVADLGWGTASAQAVTLSFWVRSSLTGTHSGSVGNSGDARAYPFSYTISAANTWEFKTVPIPGDTSGTWLTTNGIGLKVSFNLGAGSSMLGAAGAWTAGEIVGVTGAVNICATNGATFYITGVQIEVGAVTNPVFERRAYGLELSLCQRYYQAIGIGTLFGGRSSTQIEGPLQYLATMRANPTVSAPVQMTIYDAFGNAFGQSSPSITGTITSSVCDNGQVISLGNYSGLTQGRTYWISNASYPTAAIRLSAEL